MLKECTNLSKLASVELHKTGRNIKLTIAYDGTDYLGWQKTETGASIEEAMENVLVQVLQHPVSLQAASRTDAGVHAAGQVVNFFTSKDIPLNKLKYSLNCLLPHDIAVNAIQEAPVGFHPTLDCKGKEYHYHVCYGRIQLPPQRLYAWHYPYELDLEVIRNAIPLLIGQRDYSVFCNVKKNHTYSHYIRNVESIDMIELPDDCLRFEICGNNFLYKMVRNIVGTLVYVGRGKIAVDELQSIITEGDRTRAGMTAHAHGLKLHRVLY